MFNHCPNGRIKFKIMDYKYTICFDYDGKYHECSFESTHAYSQDHGDEMLMMDFITFLIERFGYYKKGNLVTSAVLENENGDKVCLISDFEVVSNLK